MVTLEAVTSRQASGWHTPEFRALSLARHAESGLNAEEFCRREGINSRTFGRRPRQARGLGLPGLSGLVLAPVSVQQDIPACCT